MADPSATPAFARHNHNKCRDGVIARVEETCRGKGLRLTPVRRRVLEILLEEHKALGAYDLLERLRAENMGSAPPVVYRALDFLVTHGFAHKLERKGAFVACGHPDDVHTPAFMICTSCETVAEADLGGETNVIDRAAKSLGFSINTQVVEAEGLCPTCTAADVTS